MRLALAPVVVALALAAPAAQETQEIPPLERLVHDNLILRPPPNHCVAPEITLALARSVGLPAGAELLPGSCNYRLPGQEDPGSWIPLLGLTVGEALERLKAFDPRYHWIESGGILIVRPIDAWGDGEHFLHEPIGEFRVEEESIQAALDRIRGVLSNWRRRSLLTDFPARTEQGAWPISVDLSASSAILALDAIVRAHGAATWTVRYCKPEARAEYATIGVRTHDNGGFGFRVWPSVPTGVQGKSVDPCR
jgi:hypothetical protein